MTHMVLAAIVRALDAAFVMGWDILWALVLGFILSGVVQAVVTKGEMSRLLPDARPRTILLASALGAASSSCSYAAVALARSLFRKGADFNAAMAFQFASTNLVLELGIILWVLMGWQFTLAEFVGGPIMIVLLNLMLRRAMTPARLAEARARRGSAAGATSPDPAMGVRLRCGLARCSARASSASSRSHARMASGGVSVRIQVASMVSRPSGGRVRVMAIEHMF